MVQSLRMTVVGVVSVLAITSCGGTERGGADTAAAPGSATTPPATTDTSTSAASQAPGGAVAPASGTAQAATGKTWDVKMLGDAQGYRFEPAMLTIKRGDAVRWTVVSGPPHNVTFWSDSIPSGASTQLQANMSQTMAPLSSPMESNIGATYTVSFAGVPAGAYKYYCTPHLAVGMKAQLTVQ
jgi:plastocyanin